MEPKLHVIQQSFTVVNHTVQLILTFTPILHMPLSPSLCKLKGLTADSTLTNVSKCFDTALNVSLLR